jgi:hypothetical protein
MSFADRRFFRASVPRQSVTFMLETCDWFARQSNRNIFTVFACCLLPLSAKAARSRVTTPFDPSADAALSQRFYFTGFRKDCIPRNFAAQMRRRFDAGKSRSLRATA